MENTVVGGVEKLLENPIARIGAATSLLLVALRGVAGLLFGVVDLLGVFESLFFERTWNIAQGEWIAIVIVVGAWAALGSMMNLDTGLLGGAAGVFLFMSAVMANIRGDLPEVISDFYSLVTPGLFLVAVALGLSALSRAIPVGVQRAPLFGDAASNSGLGGGAPAPTPTPPPAPTPAPSPAPDPAPVANQAAGWLPDPKGEAKLRYWDGSTWTEHTHNG